VLEELMRHKEMREGEARSYLAPYQFRNEDVFKPLSALSGGERARLALAILALEGVNFLLLDEPTNHLDIPAREALQALLEDFRGTVLLVSHDRYLIDRLATQIWELRGGKLHIFRGSYREYVLRSATALAPGAKVRTTILPPKPMVRDNSRETRRRQEELNKVEERIRTQEAALQKLSRELQKAGEKQSYERLHDLSWQVSKTQATLDELMTQWERLAG
jgi:ATP-binding cassette subfamily F protein 3